MYIVRLTSKHKRARLQEEINNQICVLFARIASRITPSVITAPRRRIHKHRCALMNKSLIAYTKSCLIRYQYRHYICIYIYGILNVIYNI